MDLLRVSEIVCVKYSHYINVGYLVVFLIYVPLCVLYANIF